MKNKFQKSHQKNTVLVMKSFLGWYSNLWLFVLVIRGSSGLNGIEECAWLIVLFIVLTGVGVDLVCLAEQPLHAVPLLKYYVEKKPDSSSSNPEVSTSPHIIPQWVNLSYYSKSHRKSAVFIPRMQVPQPPPGHVSSKYIFDFDFLIWSFLGDRKWRLEKGSFYLTH